MVGSADVFIEGATILANHLRIPSFLVGIVILGLGTVSTRDSSICISSATRQP
ncbi:hypothetical protein [Psychrobacter sp.]|uniref:hypothetical protein n=1 Tax=Psychrobacter sp. TaxID=56811 RepID=UPI003BB0EE53